MAKDMEEGKVLAGLMYLVSIFSFVGIIISVVIWALKRENSFINYHFKQLLMLWICGIIVGVVGAITSVILIGFLVWAVGGIFLFIVWLMGMIYAFSGKQQPLPLIGKWAENWFKF